MKFVVGLLLLLTSTASLAARTIDSLPWSESFNTNSYGDLVWTTQGATHTWAGTAGFNGSGAAKFTGPQSEGYSGIGQVILASSLQPEQLNVRFLIWHGRMWSSMGNGGKLLIMNRDGNRGRPMLIYGEPSLNTTDTLAPCDGTVCAFRNRSDGTIDLTSYWADGREPFKIGNGTTGRAREWICIEVEANARAGTMTLYIDTQDGAFRDRYLARPLNDTGPGGVWRMVDIIGGYMNRGSVRQDAENYFMLDELAISTTRIGPPASFHDGPTSTRPVAPVLLSVQ